MLGKKTYLKRLTTKFQMPSVDVGLELEGSTPPSVFIGCWNYPKVYAGPMIAPLSGDTTILDTPESWIPYGKSQEDIISYRMNLVRGKHQVGINELENVMVEKLQEISLSSASIQSEAQFGSKPSGVSFSDHHAPHGPSALLESFDIDYVKWDHELERVYYDTDLMAAEALKNLHQKKVPFSNIQKAFSVGTMGLEGNRRLVPTRWSITACDSTIADYLLEEVKHNELLETYRVHEFQSLKNYYSILLIPTHWQYEWMEAFLHVLGREKLIFTDFEDYNGKKGYSKVGGCYYTSKMAILEALAHQKLQAGAIVFREAYSGYVPLGVFNVRENIRNAMEQPHKEFEDLKTALSYVDNKLQLPLDNFVKKSDLLQELMFCRQTTLDFFLEQ